MSSNPTPLKLFTIGDSISQGFMSLAAARTDLSYSSIVAREMGWISDYQFPRWDKGGHPLNLELLFRNLMKRIGNKWEGWNLVEAIKILDTVNDLLEDLETYYETGGGRYDADYIYDHNSPDFFHNIAVRGFNISDAWSISQDLSAHMIRKAKGTGTNDRFTGPSASFFRTAARVLNSKPSLEARFNTYTAIDWLKYHSQNSGIENVFLWLGANNVLGTITEMGIRQTPGNLTLLPKIDSAITDDISRRSIYALYEVQYNKYNLWHIDDFSREYEQLLAYVDEAINTSETETRIFVGTIPFVTILPLARGMGKEFEINNRRYFEYYTYFPFDDEKLADLPTLPVLRLSEVLFIEQSIKQYNDIIKKLAKEHNDNLGKERFYVVDISTSFEQLAFRRNNGVPPYPLPDYINNHYPKPDTRYYERHPKQGSKGGLFSLDGVHPSAIGQGILAYEFMKAMIAAGVKQIPTETGYIINNTADASAVKVSKSYVPKLNWENIYKEDLLYNQPIPLVADMFKHDSLKKLVLRFSEFLTR
jgi:hypothetical protein